MNISISLWSIFWFALVLWALLSLILFYHWWRYRAGNAGVIIAGIIYLAGSAFIILIIMTILAAPLIVAH